MPDAGASLALLLGVDGFDVARSIVERAKLAVGFESQEIGRQQSSLASSGTVLSSLGSIPIVPDELIAGHVAEIVSWIQSDGSLHAQDAAGQHKTSWASSQCLAAAVRRPHLIPDRGAVVRLAQYVLTLQTPSGGWPLRPGGEADHCLYSLYPVVAVASAAKARLLESEELYAAAARAAPYFRQRARAVALHVAERLIATYLLEFAGRLTGDTDPGLAVAVEDLEHGLWRDGRLQLRPPPVMAADQPLWHAQLNAALCYLLTRRFWPPQHPISATLGFRLVSSFDQSQLGWRNADTPGPPYSWTTALGLLATWRLASDVQRAELEPSGWIERARTLSTAVDPYEFDVCISFSGVQRDVAQAIRDRLVDAGLRVFYDDDFKHELLGADLGIYLQTTYLSRSRYAVAVLSEAFLDSDWGGNWEWRAVLARMVQSRETYVLPYFWEKVDVPGLNPTIGYLSRDKCSPEEFADIVIRKVLTTRGDPPEE